MVLNSWLLLVRKAFISLLNLNESLTCNFGVFVRGELSHPSIFHHHLNTEGDAPEVHGAVVMLNFYVGTETLQYSVVPF